MNKFLSKFFDSAFLQAHYLNCDNIFSFLEKDKKAALLDLGCDDGKWTMKIARKIGTKDISGIELVEEKAKKAEKKGINSVISDLNKRLPFKKETFDVVHANQVIEHVSDLDHFVTEIVRVLKPGGYAVVSTENGSSWHNIFAALMGWQMFSLSNLSYMKPKSVGNPLSLYREEGKNVTEGSWTHKTIFNYLGFKEFFELHGFENVEILGAGYPPLPPILGKIDPRHALFITLKAYKPD